jgi:hypothetical protein
MGSFVLRLPPMVVVFPPVGGEGGVVGACTKICIGNTSVWGGRYGGGTIVGGCRYHIGLARTMLGRVRVAITWNAWNLGGGWKKGIWVMAWGTISQTRIFPWSGGESKISGAVVFSRNS